ncbi:MAG: sulfatase-like hydrolase/transferase [Devosiaceae bacterium]
MESKPNIVMVMTDQHAARIMGCAGDAYAHTPALDRLASQGTRFENCYCPSPLCVPSRMAFLTGLEPHQSGVLTNDDYLASDIPTIAQAMGSVGYDCHLVGRMHFYGPDQQHGFAHRPIGDIGASYPGKPAPDIGALTKGRGNRGPELEHSGAGETSYQAYDHAVMEHAHRTLKEAQENFKKTGRPYFLLISLFCPHPPYIARREDYNAFAHTLAGPRLSAPIAEHPAISDWRKAGKVDGVSEEAMRKSRAGYYGLVKMIDRLAGSIFDEVADDLDTLCIYTSDHGESLGERGLWWKSTMYDESAKVPLIMRGPGYEAGKIDERVTNLMDLSATLLAEAGAPSLPGHTGRDIRTKDDWLDQTTSSYYGGLMNIDLPPLQHRMIRTGDLKLVAYNGAAPTLYNLADDPDELNDLADDPAYGEQVTQLYARLMDGWDPEAIAQRQSLTRARTAIIRDWVKTTNPPEPMRWVDLNKDRNRYE